MKKFLTLLVLLALAALLLLGGKGLGLGAGFGAAFGNMASEDGQQKQDTPDPVQDTEAPDAGEQNDPAALLSVSVVNNEYFYQNQRIELDDLADILAGTEGDFVVEITDDNAALKTYNRLLDKLTEMGIAFTEVTAD